jgi:hypothetical protein
VNPELTRAVALGLDTPVRTALQILESNVRTVDIDYGSFARQAIELQFRHAPVPVWPQHLQEYERVRDATLVLVRTESTVMHAGWLLWPLSNLTGGRSCDGGHTVCLPIAVERPQFVPGDVPIDGMQSMRTVNLVVDTVQWVLDPERDPNPRSTWVLIVEPDKAHQLYDLSGFVGPICLNPTIDRAQDLNWSRVRFRQEYEASFDRRTPSEHLRHLRYEGRAQRPAMMDALARGVVEGMVPTPTPHALRRAKPFDEWLKETSELIDECSMHPRRRDQPPDWAKPLDKP